MGKAITLSFYPLPGLLGVGDEGKGVGQGWEGLREGVCFATGAGCISSRTNSSSSKVLECRAESNPLRPFATPYREGSAIISFSARCLSSLLSRWSDSSISSISKELTSFVHENIRLPETKWRDLDVITIKKMLK